MKIRALKTFYGEGAIVRKGTVVDVAGHRGSQLIAKGYAIAFSDKVVVPQARRDEGEASVASPFMERLTGGLIGGEDALSSLQEGRQPRRRRSKLSEEDAE